MTSLFLIKMRPLTCCLLIELMAVGVAITSAQPVVTAADLQSTVARGSVTPNKQAAFNSCETTDSNFDQCGHSENISAVAPALGAVGSAAATAVIAAYQTPQHIENDEGQPTCTSTVGSTAGRQCGTDDSPVGADTATESSPAAADVQGSRSQPGAVDQQQDEHAVTDEGTMRRCRVKGPDNMVSGHHSCQGPEASFHDPATDAVEKAGSPLIANKTSFAASINTLMPSMQVHQPSTALRKHLPSRLSRRYLLAPLAEDDSLTISSSSHTSRTPGSAELYSHSQARYFYSSGPSMTHGFRLAYSISVWFDGVSSLAAQLQDSSTSSTSSPAAAAAVSAFKSALVEALSKRVPAPGMKVLRVEGVRTGVYIAW
jgi:hypothetical protein